MKGKPCYGLEDVVGSRANPGPGLNLLIRVPDPWDTLGALIGEVQQGVSNQETKWKAVTTWDALLNGPPLMDKGIPQGVGEVKASSVGRFVRILRRVVKNRQSGLFVQQRATRKACNLGEEIRRIQGGQTTVVDIAKLTDEERSLVFGHIIQEVYGMYAEANLDERTDLPKKVIIFVDELNKYAPSHRGDSESSILEYVLDIAARGRSLGVVLISAEQFMSEVHGQVVGNCSTKVIGRSDSSELSDAAYRFIAQDVKAHLTRLDKGELLLSHPLSTTGKDRVSPPSLSVNWARANRLDQMALHVIGKRLDWRRWVTPKLLETKPIHRWYVFPHSFSSELVHALIREWNLTRRDRILDPFAGAGTTLLAAKEMLIPAQGYDLSPLAVLASRVKLEHYDPVRLSSSAKKLVNSLDPSRWNDAHRLYPKLVSNALPGRLLSAFENVCFKIDGLDCCDQERDFFRLALLTILPRYSHLVATGGWLKMDDQTATS